jgi:hypothetical protein
MDFTLEKSIEINPSLLNDNFHSNFFIQDIQSSLTVLKLLNSKDKTNVMIERGLVFGIIIVFSKSSNKYYLFYREKSFLLWYEEALKFKNLIDADNDEYTEDKIHKYLSYFVKPTGMGKIFNKIINREPIRLKCIDVLDLPNDYVIKYSHDMRLIDRIHRNPFFNEISKDKTSYYNFIIDKDGIVIGEVIDSLENGVVHHLLVDKPEDEVYIAGEIKINDNKLLFNFYSGTYSAPQKTTSSPILSYFLELLVTKILKMHKIDKQPLDEVKLDNRILLPRKAFDKAEIELFCSKFNNKIVKIPDGHRCINNTYENLTPAVKQQIEDSFRNNKNLLCDDYVKLFPTIVPKLDLVEEKTIFDTIENELKQFGLNKIKLGTFEQLKVQFRSLIDNPLNFATFKEGVTVDAIGSKSIEYNRIRPDGSTERKIFTFKKFLSAGSFNKTDIYIDKTTHDYKEYIFRSSTSSSFEDQFKSFYENLKHIILYILIRKNLGNIKFIPKPYHFGLKKDSRGNITLYMIMEKGECTLDKHFQKSKVTDLQIKKTVFSIYVDLWNIDSLFSNNINFKHNDLKCNNVVVSSIGAPLIIDFGLSQFDLIDAGLTIKFKSCESFIKSKYYYNVKGYNIIHDLLHLISSFNFVYRNNFKPFEILRFTKNNGSNILDTDIITSFIEHKYGREMISDSQLFRKFYSDFNLQSYSPSIIPITPIQLADNIGLQMSDVIIDEFEIKYRKYKEKYLNLKNQI